MQDLKTATFKEMGAVKKELRKHGDYIDQLREQNESMEARIAAIEAGRFSAGSDAPSSRGAQPNLLVMGGWPQDTAKDVLLRELGDCLSNIGIKDSFSDIFCTGPRRGYALALVKEVQGESPQDLKRRLINIAQQIRYASPAGAYDGKWQNASCVVGQNKAGTSPCQSRGKNQAAHSDHSARRIWERGSGLFGN